MDVTSQASGPQPSPGVARVKALLMRAWRGRWDEVQWGIRLKKVLGSSTSDARDLAEVLIGQALVGNHPNSLIISYLKHSVFAQVIPATAAFKYIATYDDFSRPFCLLGLIDLAQDFAVNLNFCSGIDGGLSLCKILQSLVLWLLKTMLRAVQKFQEESQLEYMNVLGAAAVAVDKIADIETVRGLLYIARSEEPEVYLDLEQTELNVRGTMSQIAVESISSQVRQNVSAALSSLARVQDMVLPTEPVLDVTQLPICPAIVTLVALEAVLNPTNDIQPFVDQLCILEKILKLQRPYLLCELLRACFLGLLDAHNSAGSQEEFMWCAFTFLKLPQIFIKIQQQSPSHDFSTELEAGVDTILNSSHMLDLTDIKLNCDSLVFLLNECKKYGLLSEGQTTKLQKRRSNETQKPRSGEATTQPCASLIIRAESTVTSILKTLDADCSKSQDNLLDVLCHMLSGKSFELILAAAAATGKLQSFCMKLIKFNEFAKHGGGDSAKASGTRALLFDISFLMLCHITQVYGTDMIMSSPECIDTFFVQWALRCLPEDGKYKSVDISMPVDANKVDSLLNAFTSGTEITQGVPKWHDVCTNAPYAIQEILFAWEHGALTSDSIKIMLSNVKSRMLCLPVVISAWLCSYINMLSEEARVKPLAMLQQLTQPVDRDSDAERSHLMTVVLQKMIFDILPLSKRPPMPQYIPRNSLPADIMTKTMKTVFSKGWVDMTSLHTLEQLVNLCGSDWFADRLVKTMLESKRIEDLNQHLSLVFALTHIDLDHITLSLLLHTVPALLLSSENQGLLTDPRGYTLAKLCVLAITTSHTAKSSQKDSGATCDAYVSNEDVLKAEIYWTLNSIDKHYSYNSNTEIEKIFQCMFPDSSIAQKFSCGEKKTAYYTSFGLAPFFSDILKQQVSSQRSYVLLFDESLNHKTKNKQLDIHVRFWSDETVNSRYFTSQFMGHASSEQLLEHITEGVKPLHLKSVLQVSMDGPNVNWKFMELFRNQVKEQYNSDVLNVGSCGLHIVNGAFKDSSVQTGWELESFLRSCYVLFKETPARREDYTQVTSSTEFPLKFCKHRWLENLPVAQRAIRLLPHLQKFVESIEKKKIKDPKTISYKTVVDNLKDVLLPVKLHAFLSLAQQTNPFLTIYQTDRPMIPFLKDDLIRLVKHLMIRVVKRDVLKEAGDNVMDIMKIDVGEKKNLIFHDVDIGTTAQKQLKTLVTANKVSQLKAQELRVQFRDGVVRMIKKLQEKSPIKYSLVRSMTCLSPNEMAENPNGCIKKFENVLRVLGDHKKIDDDACDDIKRQYVEFIDEVVPKHKSEFESFNHMDDNCRIDKFFFELLSTKKHLEKLWFTVKDLLLISHGQATVERGFSTNKEIYVENLQERSFIAQRQVIDHLQSVGGVLNVKVTKQMMVNVSAARQRYMGYLDEQKAVRAKNEVSLKRKNVIDDIEELKSKKKRLLSDADSLVTSADKLSGEAESATGVQQIRHLVAKSNSHRSSAKQKQSEADEFSTKLDDLLATLKSTRD